MTEPTEQVVARAHDREVVNGSGGVGGHNVVEEQIIIDGEKLDSVSLQNSENDLKNDLELNNNNDNDNGNDDIVHDLPTVDEYKASNPSIGGGNSSGDVIVQNKWFFIGITFIIVFIIIIVSISVSVNTSSGTVQSVSPPSTPFATPFATPVATPVSVAAPISGKSSISSNLIWINEIHYDNADADSGEFVEIAYKSTVDITGMNVVLYNRGTVGSNSSNAQYITTSLDTATKTNLGSVRFAVVQYAPSTGIQNGKPDGVALVDATGKVMQFLFRPLSISTMVGLSHQLLGTGCTYSAFTWSTVPTTPTMGTTNNNQIFNC